VPHPKNGEHDPSMIPLEPGSYKRARRLLSLGIVVRDALPMAGVDDSGACEGEDPNSTGMNSQ
jgi:hypothetical protein